MATTRQPTTTAARKKRKPRKQVWRSSGGYAYLIVKSPRYGQHVIVVDKAALPVVAQHRWWLDRSAQLLYARTSIDGRAVRMHQLLMPQAELIDHRDGNTLNNVTRNLRVATPSLNAYNSMRTPGASGARGVDWNRGRVRARIAAQGQRHNLGSFDSVDQASRAYQDAAEVLYGDAE